MALFTKAFWVQTLELVVVAFASTFGASLVLTNGTPTSHSFIAAAVAGGIAAIYAFTKQVGSVQTVNAIQSGKPNTVTK